MGLLLWAIPQEQRMTLPTLAITGSSGHIGGLVAQHLANAGLSQRLLLRTVEKAPSLPGAVAVQSSYENTDAARTALADVTTLFMVSGSESEDRVDQHRAFVDAAAAAGVDHIVYLSFFGAAPDAVFTLARDHWATEQHIIESGMSYTFLRDNLYTDFFINMVGEGGVLRGPAADGRVASVTRADIARVAAVVLRNPAEHVGKTYDLTGPEALTMEEVAGTITEVTGREVTFHNETLEEAYESRLAWEAPQWQYDAWVSTYTAIAAGELVPVSDAVERLTGTPAESLRDFLTTVG
jgi:NAD(P)H dehydrogenase (quinone)